MYGCGRATISLSHQFYICRESKEEPPSQNSEQDGHSTPQLSKEAELPAKAAGATEDGGPIGSEIVPDTKTGPLNELSKAEPAAATEATGGLANGRGVQHYLQMARRCDCTLLLT